MGNFVKIGCINPYVHIAKPVDNAKDIIELIENSNATINVFPELSITGYSCGPLFNDSKVLKESEDAVRMILRKNYNSITIVGAPLKLNGALYNCAFVLKGDRILGIVPKKYLAISNGQGEDDWFTGAINLDVDKVTYNGDDVPFGNILFTGQSYSFGIEICEDLWVRRSPSINLCLAGASIMFNLSASYDEVGKDEARRSLVFSNAIKNTCGYVYISCGASESNSKFRFKAQNIVADPYKVVIDSVNYAKEANTTYAYLDLDLITKAQNENKDREQIDPNFKYIKVQF